MPKVLILNSFPCDWDPDTVEGSPENAYILNCLADSGFELFILAPPGGDACGKRIPYRIIKMPAPAGKRGNRLKRYLNHVKFYIHLNRAFISEAKEILKEEKFDLIWAIGTPAAPAAHWLGEKYRIKKAVKAPGVFELNSYHPLIKALPLYFVDLIAFSLPFDRFLLVDDGTQPDQVLLRMGRSRDQFDIFPNAYPEEWKIDDRKRRELREKLDIPEDAVTVGWAARYHPLKGVDLITPIVREILERFSGVYFVFAGFREDVFPLRHLNLRFLGMLPHREMLDFYNLIDIFIQTNRASSYGLPVIEAEYLGLPVIGFRVGASERAVVDGETGFLIRPFDLGEYVDRLSLLISDQNLREEMGRKARKWIIDNHISWKTRCEMERKALISILRE